MNHISREKIMAEQLIREHVRRQLKSKLKAEMVMENKLRLAIRNLIREAETGTEEPSDFTGINVLASLLKKIIPSIEDDYKMLTTSPDQRESFRNHIIYAVKNSLRPIEITSAVGKANENLVLEIDPQLLLAEKMTIDLDASDDQDFIDIEEEEPDDFITIDDQNETGRNFAATTFKKIEKMIVDSYDMLADQEDQDMFFDYLTTNLLLYFDKFEDELTNELPTASTPEYEKEKAKDESGDEQQEADDEPLENEDEEVGIEDLPEL
jgi:hypothetical protein